MTTTFSLTDADLEIIQEFAQEISKKYSPDETDLVPIIIKQLHKQIEVEEDREMMFAFSGSDEIFRFLSGAISVLLPIIVFPFLKKTWEKAIEKTAEKTVDAIALKFHELLNKIRKDKKNPELIQQLDILVPINWKELNDELISTSQSHGVSKAQSDKIASIVVQELKEDRILLGNLLVHVNRINIPKSK